MLSHNTISFIKSLHQKKKRNEHGLFIAEGDKLVRELLASHLVVREVYALIDWLREYGNLLNDEIKTAGVTQPELERISTLVTAPPVLAIVQIPEQEIAMEELFGGYTLVLDAIRDPGNMGTIIRTADWFGINRIIASDDCAEHWNPKVVQASMGSLTRVKIVNKDLNKFFTELNAVSHSKNMDMPAVYGTYMGGQSIYNETFAPSGLIVIGNESNGIRSTTEQFIDRKIAVPCFAAEGDSKPESLNAALATALVLSEVRRTRG
ncbi:MAG TPA: RNA methyltransferase [Bacteroidia bacterium]|nr:RNA methyltransferase [Bacteroidia bacterium]